MVDDKETEVAMEDNERWKSHGTNIKKDNENNGILFKRIFSDSPHVRFLLRRQAAAPTDGLGDNEPHTGVDSVHHSLSEDYETYNKGGHMIEFWLRPAVVALGVPLYMQLSTIKKQLTPILLSELAGCVVGVVSVVWIAKEMGASREVILSLASKSVTTPIAMEVTKAVGGIPSLTAAVVVAVGLLCAVCGYRTMGFARVKNPVAQGLSMGTAAHALGTATSMDRSQVHGAYASLGLTLNGIFTSLLTPSILPRLGV